jgi:Tfp pilus assembly protein PilV
MRRRIVSFTHRRGVTTAEVLFASTILGFMMTGMLSLTLSTVRSWEQGSSRSDSENAASLALQELARDITDAKWASVNADGSLTVQMPLVNDQECFDRAFDGDQVTYFVSGSTLYKQVGAAAATLFARDINSAQFTQSNGVVGLTITARTEAGRETKDVQFTQSVALRNRDLE